MWLNIYRIHKDRFIDLAKQASLVFANDIYDADELQELLYYPYQKSKDGSKPVNAGGVLYEKYLNLRRKYLFVGLIPESERLPEGKYATKFMYSSFIYLYDFFYHGNELAFAASKNFVESPSVKKILEKICFRSIYILFQKVLTKLNFRKKFAFEASKNFIESPSVKKILEKICFRSIYKLF